jgi:hypothetical protein
MTASKHSGTGNNIVTLSQISWELLMHVDIGISPTHKIIV